jgi:aspartyl aminopeptidase
MPLQSGRLEFNMEKEKTVAQQLKEKLFMNQKNIGVILSEEEIQKADLFCEDYKKFLDSAKTEREAVSYALLKLQNSGFKLFNNKTSYKAGDKIYYVNRNKAIIAAVIGKKSSLEGVKIAAAHIDSPRLDLKPCPLYEDSELALFKSHYYGGVKKYQWTALPLALHGVIAKKNGEVVNIVIGEDESDPCFCVTDLLPHLASEQMKRTLSEGIKGEELNILVGSRPFKDDEASERIKLNILKILNEKYDITETDFISAELEFVPAFKAKDIGFDRGLIGSYGHDDRVCAYPALMAIMNIETPEYTSIAVLADKEEIGSDGNTGLASNYLKNFIADLARIDGGKGRDALSKSTCLSADVNAAFDPTFPDVLEKRNATYINKGTCITKYTGSRGKSGTSDASAEFMAKIRCLLDDTNVIWQTGELGKIDIGGGGTVAKYIANLDVDVVDIGVPVLSMHAPYEVVSKLDVYMSYRAFFEYFNSKENFSTNL